MNLQVWDTSEDNKIEFVSLTSELLEEALNVLRNGFFPHESVCIAVDLNNNSDAVSELEGLSIAAAKDGVSVAAVEKLSRKVVGVAFNKLQILNNAEECFFDNYAKSCKERSSRGLIQFMIDVDNKIDLFKHCNVDCLLEVMFLAILPEFRKRGIGRKLCEVSTWIAKKLKNGENVKQAIGAEQSLSLEPIPQIVSALFTSPASQKIGRALKWEIVARQSYEDYFYEGKSYASVLGKAIPDTTLEFIKI